MINRILTVGGLTLLSRVTGFLRDIVMAAVLGAGPVADAFLVAFRLPNHFRAIFAEGAFAAAFVPAYARIRTQRGADAAKLFGDRIFTLLLASQIALLALAGLDPQSYDLGEIRPNQPDRVRPVLKYAMHSPCHKFPSKNRASRSMAYCCWTSLSVCPAMMR